MTTRLIILDCAGYISTFKAVIVFGSKKPVFGSIKSKKPVSKNAKNNREGGFLGKNEASKKRSTKKLEGNEVKYCDFRDFFPAHKLFAKKQWKELGARRIF